MREKSFFYARISCKKHLVMPWWVAPTYIHIKNGRADKNSIYQFLLKKRLPGN